MLLFVLHGSVKRETQTRMRAATFRATVVCNYDRVSVSVLYTALRLASIEDRVWIWRARAACVSARGVSKQCYFSDISLFDSTHSHNEESNTIECILSEVGIHQSKESKYSQLTLILYNLNCVFIYLKYT